jgi:hypothetical protein
MLASISPLGERARGNRWALTVTAFGVAAAGAAAVVGAVLGGLFGWVPARMTLLGLAAGGAGLIDAVAPRLVPTSHRQVDENWLGRLRGWVYGAGYGGQLGLGVVTVVTSATVYAWLVAAAVSGSTARGAIVGASFGVARAMPLLLVRRADSPPALRTVVARLTGWALAGRRLAAGASVAVGAVALGAAAVAR